MEQNNGIADVYVVARGVGETFNFASHGAIVISFYDHRLPLYIGVFPEENKRNYVEWKENIDVIVDVYQRNLTSRAGLNSDYSNGIWENIARGESFGEVGGFAFQKVRVGVGEGDVKAVLAYASIFDRSHFEYDNNVWAGHYQNSNTANNTFLQILGAVLPSHGPVSNWLAPGAERSLSRSDYLEMEIFRELISQGPHCFPSGTPIQLASGQIAHIDALRRGDEIAAFSGAQFGGRGGLASKRVTRLFHNVTDTWVTLSNGLTVTPGHHFLDAFGNFRTIADILETDGQVVLEDGSVTKVTGEYIHYSEQTANLYEQAEGCVSATVGNLALAPVHENISEVRILQ